MSLELTPIELLNLSSFTSLTTPQSGFMKMVFIDSWLSTKDPSGVGRDVVLDRVLTGFTPGTYSPIVPTDTVLEAFQKLQAHIYNGIGGHSIAIVPAGTNILFGINLPTTNYAIMIGRVYDVAGNNMDYRIPPATKAVSGFQIKPTGNGFLDFTIKYIY